MTRTHRRSPSLRELQEAMASLVLQPQPPARCEDLFRLPADVAPSERLAVYANGYPARVQEALVETFPALAHLLAPQLLHEIVHRYLEACPPRSYNLNDAGAELPRFLRGDEVSRRLPFLPDLAELEWTLARSFHARLEAPLEAAHLSAWTLDEWSRARLRFQPGVAVLCSEWPIRELWAARATPIEEIDIDLRERPDCVLVYRAGLEVKCESIAAAEAEALQAMLGGDTLGDLCDSLAARGINPAAVSAWFAAWLRRGLLAAPVAEATHFTGRREGREEKPQRN